LGGGVKKKIREHLSGKRRRRRAQCNTGIKPGFLAFVLLMKMAAALCGPSGRLAHTHTHARTRTHTHTHTHTQPLCYLQRMQCFHFHYIPIIYVSVPRPSVYLPACLSACQSVCVVVSVVAAVVVVDRLSAVSPSIVSIISSIFPFFLHFFPFPAAGSAERSGSRFSWNLSPGNGRVALMQKCF